MNLHEYQAKSLLAQHQFPVAPYLLVQHVNDISAEALEKLGKAPWIVKAQIHSGARGKAGGVVLVDTPDQAQLVAQRLLGQRLVTEQTTAQGLPINQLIIEAACAIEHEFYLSLTLDRARQGFTFVASSAGGMDIEQLASTQPDAIHSVFVPFGAGLQPYVARQLSYALRLTPAQAKGFSSLIQQLDQLAQASDALMIEINPLVWTKAQQWQALDCKIQIDDNALYRQPELANARDWSQEDAREREAAQWALNYIALDGNIGCMVNGAGLAMATMDLIQLHGGHPANFLDVGGGTTPERVAAAFKLITSSPNVNAIFVNIFGGIVRCDLIAEGILAAVKETGLSLPLVVRLAGTNADAGLALLTASGLNIHAETDLETAAKTAVQLAQGPHL